MLSDGCLDDRNGVGGLARGGADRRQPTDSAEEVDQAPFVDLRGGDVRPRVAVTRVCEDRAASIIERALSAEPSRGPVDLDGSGKLDIALLVSIVSVVSDPAPRISSAVSSAPACRNFTLAVRAKIRRAGRSISH